MWKKITWKKIGIVSGCLTAAITANAESVWTEVLQRAEQTPVIDGRITESEWQNALQLGRLEPGQGSEGMPDTEVWMTYTDTAVVLAIRSHEPNMAGVIQRIMGDEINPEVWTDDSVEVYLDPGNNGHQVYRVVANTEAMIHDNVFVDMEAVTDSWHSAARVAASRSASHWELEIEIPFRTLRHILVRGEVIGINVARNRYAGGETERSSLAGGAFLQPDQFVSVLVEGTVSAGEAELVSPRRGPFLHDTEGWWDFVVVQGELQADSVTIDFPNDADRPRQPFPVATEYTVNVPADAVAQMNAVDLRYRGQSIFRSEYGLLNVDHDAIGTRPRVATPIDNELLVPHPDGLSQLGNVIWSHELQNPLVRVVPFRWGMEFNEDTVWENYARDRAIVLMGSQLLSRNPEYLEKSREHGVSWILVMGTRGAFAKGAPSLHANRPWDMDPRATEALYENLDRALEIAAENEHVIGFFAGDEVWEINNKSMLQLLDDRSLYPEIDAIDREVRERFGFGHFGLPESSTDSNPYRWIATYRWLAEKRLEIAAEMRRRIKAANPDYFFMSWDSMTGHRPYYVRKWPEVFDVITAQHYPSQGSVRESAGFTTKFYHDVAEPDEFWPVPHIEHFPRSFTQDETINILSHIFRNGATGLHLWTSDHLNGTVARKGSSINERLGAPERWAVVRDLTDRLQTPFRIQQPEPDTAVFYSNTSYQGAGAPNSYVRTFNEPEWIYTLLGPHLKSAFRFIDDLAVVEQPDRLDPFKIVYVPYMPIADDAEYAALLRYVEQGGTLVVCDPLAFRNRSDASERSSGGIVPPLSSISPAPPKDARSGFDQEVTLTGLGDVYPLPRTGGQVLAQFDDGTPAILESRLGRGRVVYFAQNPLVADVIHDQGWVALFQSLQQSVSAAANQPVWNFTFPAPPAVERDHPGGVCLTGNYFEWSLSKPELKYSSAVGGSYQFSRADQIGREPANTAIRFGEGRLTDRLKGALAANDAPARDFVLQWRSNEPVEVTFQFDQQVAPDALRFFYSGDLPAGVLELSMDQKNWQRVQQWEASSTAAQKDVARLELKFEPQQAQFLRLIFDAEANPREYTLVEVDIWGED